MANLSIPTLQHLARTWRKTPDKVEKVLLHLAENPPTFNYNPIYPATEEMLVFGTSLAQIAEGIRRGTSRDGLAKNYLELLTLIHRHFQHISPDFVNTVSTRSYSVGKNLAVPFTPPLVYGIGGQLYFPWFSLWRSQPLKGEPLSLFVTLVYEVLRQDPDLEEARFEILDFSAPKAGMPRELLVIDTRDIPVLPKAQKREMLAIYAEGFAAAKAKLAAKPRPVKEKDKSADDQRQQSFDSRWFD